MIYISSNGSQILQTAVREKLTADRTYYVRTDGNDNNSGLTNDAAGAFLTIQKAVDVVSGAIDLGDYNVTIQVGNGTYNGTLLRSYTAGKGLVAIQGNTSTPSSVVITESNSSGLNVGRCFYGNECNTRYNLLGFRVTTTGTGSDCIRANGNAVIGIVGPMEFGPCTQNHLFAIYGGFIVLSSPYTINGGASRHLLCQMSGVILTTGGVTVTLTGTPAFSTVFANALQPCTISSGGFSFSGSATGTRYNVQQNAVITGTSANANFFPGNVAGTTATGGVYV